MSNKSSILISIRPEFAELIFSGDKTVELRRIIPKTLETESEVIIYVSSPVKSIVGKAKIKKIECLKLGQLWKRVGKHSGINIEYFNEYFEGRTDGYGLVLHQIKKLRRAIPLDTLRKKLNFTPPQSFMYSTEDLREVDG